MSDRRRAPLTIRRGLLVVGSIVVVVLLLGELGARLLSPYLPSPALWGDEATQQKVAQMDGRGDRCTDVVVAGNSMGRDAFVPTVFEQADPTHRRAYNASLDAASPPLLRRWLNEEVVPRLEPATVVLALSSLDVNANSKAGRAVREKYDDAPLSKAGPVGRLEAGAVRQSALLQHRTELRQPAVVFDALVRARRGERTAPNDAGGVLGADGEGLTRRALRYTGNPAGRAFLTGQLLNDFVLDEGLFEAERQLIGSLQQQGINVVLVVLPVTDDYRDSHSGGPVQFDQFLDGARRLASDARVPLIDLTTSPDLARFADTHHLNGDGAEWFSRELPDLLERNAVAVRRCGP